MHWDLSELMPNLNNIGGGDQVYVFRYGSDPLKTYLPDSDIDVTIIKAETLYG